jgi:Tol biopolymer transport system component
MNMTKLTTTGKATDAAISPDGRYVVHVMDEGGKQSLWVKQVKIASASQRIVEPADAYYGGLTFSPDGNYIYYVRAEKDNLGVGTLNRMPVLGGTPNKLVDNVRSRITFSPDGNRFAFVRRNPTTEDTALITANADGSGEQTIAARKLPDDFGGDDSGPAWSPDGKTLVCGAGNSVRNEMTVVEVQVKDGTDRPITSQTWFRVGQIAWLPDASGFIMLATPQQAFSYQIWHLSYPAGKAERISKDLNNYLSVSLTADGNSLVTVQNAAPSSIWIVPDVDVSRAKQITFGAGTGDGSYGLSWTPDGRIVYETNASGNEDIWIMNADGSNPKQLTANVRISESPVVSPDGRYILSINDRTGVPHVWRMDIDGGNPKQLTNGRGEIPQGLSADSQWVVYTSIPDIGSGKRTLWRLPINGGESVPITDKVAGESRRTSNAGVSPDGKLIAFWYRREETGSPKLRIIPFAGGEPVKTFDLPPETNRYFIRWTPYGRALTYAAARNGVWNIWSQPLEGNAPKQLTNWQSEVIFAFDWTHDGKELAIARGLQTNDVILISNSR